MEEVVENIARQQHVRHGHFPKIITLDRLFRNSETSLAQNEIVNDIPVIRLPYRGSSRYPICPNVLAQVHDADVIHVHGIDFFFDYLAVTRPIHRRPMVVSTHGGFFHTRFASVVKKIYFNTVTRASSHAYAKVIATSGNDGEIFSGIVRPSKLVVIENGVNLDKYRGKAAQTLIPTLIYFGRWSENKGLLETIDWFKQLVTQQPQWKLIIAGREYDHSQQELLARVQKNKLGESVVLAPNPSERELANLIGQSSYFICLSRHEGFGIAPIEAMSAGLTPVLSDIPPFRHLIEQSGLGALVNGNASSTVSALLALHRQNEYQYNRQRHLAQAFVERYDWEHIADKYIDIYAALTPHKLRSSPCA